MARQLQPDDPAVLEAVLKRISEMTREEWLERLRKRPDFDEAWVLPDPKETSAADGATATTEDEERRVA